MRAFYLAHAGGGGPVNLVPLGRMRIRIPHTPARRQPKSRAVMGESELRRALVRAVVLELRNGCVTPFPRWGWERPRSLYALRSRRAALAKEYSTRYRSLNPVVFERRLPCQGTIGGVYALIGLHSAQGQQRAA